jgi:hypothetical protein
LRKKGTILLLAIIIVLLAAVSLYISNTGSIFTPPTTSAPDQIYSPTVPSVNQKVVCIVLDDGWKTHLDVASIMQQYNFSASYPIITSYVGYPAYLNWDDIKLLAQKGNDIISQTSTHSNLSAVNATTLNSELTDSRQTLRERGYGADILIYPYGEATHNQTVTATVATVYQAAVGVEAAKNDLSTLNRYDINSYIISDQTTLDQFTQILTGTGGGKVTVLCYNKVSDDTSGNSVSTTAFEAQMQYLSSNGYTVETLSQLLLKKAS